MEVIRILGETLKYYLVDARDPRVDDWFLMQSPIPIICLLLVYNYFVLNLGPKLMEKRAPFELKYPMILYNLSQICANGYFVFESFRLIWLPREYNLLCEEVNYSSTDFLAQRVLFFTYLFFWTKVLDLLDTIFMVLRKKNNQISFLHVYHHTGMVIANWICTKYVGGGHPVFFGTVNAFVHTIMYSYYFLTALYPQYKKSIWWKKHITEIQLIQFVVTTLHSLAALFNPSCGFPKFLLTLFIPQDIFMFFLFMDFYVKAYWKTPKVDVSDNREKTVECNGEEKLKQR
ncbi:elongation of very long chain fatty acids protein 7-like [Cimex lectularius]|uniref:Elongation of very long chain fatty acids protein n=1 Tax=Cimex lectularius TaxID=79782 RepID=A0A8I6RP98_CIMLE|nr:elongation of very long chain fatty acids protein 7-like [Cimex lectularius]